jgi:putative ABC transport system ATP-binding protein
LLRREAVGFVFQSFNLIPTLTAVENVALPIQFGRGRDAMRRAADLLETIGLGDRMHHKPSQLSGGEQQRVAIARALANDPAIVLLDEPTGDLDSATGKEILGLLTKLNREEKVTLMVATHDAAVAAICSRVVKLRDGKIESDAAVPAAIA